MKHVQIFALCVPVMLFFGMQPARAGNTTVRISIQTQPNSPVAITNCSMVYYNTVTMVAGTPNAPILVANTLLSFKNTSERSVAAVKFGFVFKDASGSTEFTGYGEDSGLFSPGAQTNPNLAPNGAPRAGSPGAFTVSFPSTGVGEMDCFVSAVRYQDGAIWKSETRSESKS